MNIEVVTIVMAVGQVVFTVISGLILYIFHDIKETVITATRSIQELNIKIAVIITKQESQAEALEDLYEQVKNRR